MTAQLVVLFDRRPAEKNLRRDSAVTSGMGASYISERGPPNSQHTRTHAHTRTHTYERTALSGVH
eukprot:380876-Pyramimonas_sp.AAC.1